MGLKGFDSDDEGQWTFRDVVASVIRTRNKPTDNTKPLAMAAHA